MTNKDSVIAEIMQAITDPENQPSQYGTVTLDYLNNIVALIDETALMLRGMTLDQAIPQHAKGAMQSRIKTLEEAIEKLDE